MSNFNPYDDDPFGITSYNTTANVTTTTTLTPTINTNSTYNTTNNAANSNNNIFKPRAFTTSPNNQPQFNSNYFQSSNINTNYNNNMNTPTHYNNNNTLTSPNSNIGIINNPTSTPKSPSYTTPRRSTIGFEDDFSDTTITTPLDTNFTIESSDFFLSLGSSPSHRHTLSGASTNTINTSPQLMPSSNINMNMNHHFITSPRSVMNNTMSTGNTQMMSNNNSNNGGGAQNSFWNNTSSNVITGTNTSPIYSNVNNTPRQSIANSNEFMNPYNNNTTTTTTTTTIGNNNNNNIENPSISSVKSIEKQSNTTMKRRSRTMFESNNRNNNFSKDLLDFNPFSTNTTNNNTNNTTTTTTNNNNINNTITNSNDKSQPTSKTPFDLLDLKNSLQEYDELSGESSPVNSRPKSMKFLKSNFDHFDSNSSNNNIRNSINSSNTNDDSSPSTTNSSISNSNINNTNNNTNNNNTSNTNTNNTFNQQQQQQQQMNREILFLGMDNKLTIPENILMICLSDSGIVKSYVSDQIEELCMMGIFCELILHKKMTTRPLRDLCKGKFGLQVLDSKPIQITNKRDTSIIELLNEVLNLINGINEKCLAKDVNQMTVKDYIKILCLGRKVGNVLIYKIANILTRIGKQLSERKIVDYKKTLFLFLSLPIKDKIERDRCLNELILFLKMLRTELDVQDELTSIYSGTLTYDTCTERMLKNRHDFVIYTLLGIFTMNNTDILSNDIIKNENDRKALKELSFSIFNINNNNNNGNNSKNTSFKKQQLKKQQQQHTTLIDEQLMDMVESDDDEQSEDNMLSINNSTTINGITNTIGGNSLTSSNNNNLTLDKKTNINLHHFPEGLNYFEEIALQLKRCIYGSNKQ